MARSRTLILAVVCVLIGAALTAYAAQGQDPPPCDPTPTPTPIPPPDATPTPTPTPTPSPTPEPTTDPAAGPPAAPAGVTATLTSTRDIHVDWADNTEPDLAYYAVRWSTDPLKDKATWTVLGRPTVSDITHAAPPAGTTVYYYVTAVDTGKLVSDRSDTASVTVPNAEPAPPPTDTGTVLWGGGFEDGTASIYKTVRTEGSGTRATSVVTTEQARTGTHSLKITIPAASSAGTVGRYQLVAGMPDGHAGDDRWYGFSFRLGDDWNLAQVVDNRDFFLNGIGFRYTGTSVNGPGSNVEGVSSAAGPMLRTGTNLSNTVGATTAGRALLGPLVKNQWIDLVFHVKWSTGADGVREVWRDGVKVADYRGATLGTSSPFEHRMGVYEGVSVDQTRTMYVDNHRVGTSYTAVDPSL